MEQRLGAFDAKILEIGKRRFAEHRLAAALQGARTRRKRTGSLLQRETHAQSANPPTPTTKILAIGTLNPGVDPAAARAILPIEVRETVKLYLDGKIDQWYSLQGRPGVAFILNVTDAAAAHAMLEKLPLGQAHLMSFELTPLAPLNPLR
ncbi:hypothetical protein [Bradyrhizobium centrolobii]|uniref:hypothetical protein n=1 Tax=Bradyrhizobium centrolobii TaxID=1505087 RepID=UPI001FD9EA00|nr:hypothetical protein [Bradyrhizobium centrolobii]